MKIRLILALLWTILSCENNTPPLSHPDKIEVNNLSVFNGQLSELLVLEDSINLDFSNVFSVIDKVQYTEQGIFVLCRFDANAGVFWYNENGDFIKSIGYKGEGPGGINRPYDFLVNASGIEILDLGNIHYFDLKGEYLHSKPLLVPATRMIKLEDEYVFYTGDRNESIVIADFDLNEKEAFLPIRANHGGMVINGLQKVGNSVLIQRELNNTIFEYENGKLTPRVTISDGSNEFSQEEVDAQTNYNDVAKKFPGVYLLSINFIDLADSQFFYLKKGSMTYPVFWNKKRQSGKLVELLDVTNDLSSEEYFPYIIGYNHGYLISFKENNTEDAPGLFTIFRWSIIEENE